MACNEETSRRAANFKNARSAVSLRLRLRTVLLRCSSRLSRNARITSGFDIGQMQLGRRFAQVFVGKVQEQHSKASR